MAVFGQRWRLGLASGCAAAVCLAMLPGASAVDDDELFPSRERVRQAQERAATTADRVDAIEAALVAADQRLEIMSIEAAKAVEAFNGARYKLQQAREAARGAARTADAAAADVRDLEDQLSSAVVATFENSGTLTNLGILIRDPNPDALLEHLDAYAGVTGALQSDLDRYESAKIIADVMAARAESAVAEREAATEAAKEAKQAAEAAVADAEAAVSSIAAEKDALVRELARLQNISVELARQRQEALAEQAAEEAAEEAAEQAAEQAEQEQPEQEQLPTESDPPAEENEPPPSDESDIDPPPSDDGENDPPPDNDPPPPPESDPPPDNDPPPPPENDPPDNDPPPPPPDDDPPAPHGARAAIKYAKAQLGEPYVYGAAGPDSWDCSGLTMRAWGAAGKSLSHWSVAQYYETTPISFSDLRRGDLLFWGDSDDPDTIYHVAMYLGRGKMIQAPRPGRSVEIVSMYYWILPNFYTRV